MNLMTWFLLSGEEDGCKYLFLGKEEEMQHLLVVLHTHPQTKSECCISSLPRNQKILFTLLYTLGEKKKREKKGERESNVDSWELGTLVGCCHLTIGIGFSMVACCCASFACDVLYGCEIF